MALKKAAPCTASVTVTKTIKEIKMNQAYINLAIMMIPVIIMLVAIVIEEILA